MHPKIAIKKQLEAAAKIAFELGALTARITAIEKQNEELKNMLIALNEKIDGTN